MLPRFCESAVGHVVAIPEKKRYIPIVCILNSLAHTFGVAVNDCELTGKMRGLFFASVSELVLDSSIYKIVHVHVMATSDL